MVAAKEQVATAIQETEGLRDKRAESLALATFYIDHHAPDEFKKKFGLVR